MKVLSHFGLAIAVVLVITVGVWIGWATPFFSSPEAPEANGIVFDDPKQISDFQLVDHKGMNFNVSRLQNHWSLVYFGFTSCPDYCPMTLAQFAQVDEELGIASTNSIQYVFISVDPARDTLDQLGPYVEYFFPGLIGVTGQIVELENLASQLAIGFKIHTGTGTNYLVDHSNAVLLVNPEGQFQAIFTAPHTAERLAADIRAIQKWYLDSA